MRKFKSAFSITIIFIICITSCSSNDNNEIKNEPLSNQQLNDFPKITMINQIDYFDKHHPIGGCGFLLDIGNDTLAVTAKHVIKFSN